MDGNIRDSLMAAVVVFIFWCVWGGLIFGYEWGLYNVIFIGALFGIGVGVVFYVISIPKEAHPKSLSEEVYPKSAPAQNINFRDRTTIHQAEELNIDFKKNFIRELRNLRVCTDEERNSLSKEFGTRWRFDVTFTGDAPEVTEYFTLNAKNDLNLYSREIKSIQFQLLPNRITIDSYVPSQNLLVFSEIIKIKHDKYRYWHGIW